MEPTKKTGRILGILFLTSIILGVTGTVFRGLSGADLQSLDFLSTVVDKSNDMKLAIYLDIVCSAVTVIIALFLFPFIKKYSPRLALGYFGMAIINFVVIIVSNILHVLLLTLSADFSMGEAVSNTGNYLLLAKMLHESYYWTHFLMLMLYSVGNSILFYFFLKSQYIPKWLSLWGLVASVIVFFGGALQIVDIEVSFLLFAQNGIFMLLFTAWLLAKGFSVTSNLKSKV